PGVEGGPLRGRGSDEGGVRVAVEDRLNLFVQFGPPGTGAQRIVGQFPHDVGSDGLAGDGDALARRGRQGLVDQGGDAGGWKTADTTQVGRDSLSTSAADLRWGGGAGQPGQGSLRRGVDSSVPPGGG